MKDDTREFLAAVLDAINIPAPATFADREAFQLLLEDRVLDAVVALTGALGEPPAADWGLGWHTDYLRKRLATKPPTTYRHYDADGGAA
ncbi:hypothetical protein [Streptomyces brasiliensis]|uniref:Uncharacterized protein n=1 Tax=Streptomyces brasiliensis TaxID=1954 RepID=A0A917L4A7_9ACTN|nr:hypothetical protein [Streptomyces brasiliensis]GGJ43766.1 hypothetical protein GCM10010121_063740 [Streptomyces brasiliensis]